VSAANESMHWSRRSGAWKAEDHLASMPWRRLA